MRSGGAIPPPQKGYLSDTCAMPCEDKAEKILRETLRAGAQRTNPTEGYWRASLEQLVPTGYGPDSYLESEESLHSLLDLLVPLHLNTQHPGQA